MTHSGSEQGAMVIAASDDRKLAISTFGPPSGFPVLYHHGTPGSRLVPTPDPGLLDRAGVRLLTFDRPGYGSSSRRLGRSVADAAADAGLVADAFGAEHFAVLGYSGGGPHALACAALLPGRVTRCATIASIAPLDAAGLDFFAGMSEGNVSEFDKALAGREALAAELDPVAAAVADDVFAFIASLASEVGDGDAAALERPEVTQMFATSFTEGLRPGSGGWVDDDLAFASPWGFDVGAITVPVGIWQGTVDRLVPLGHGGWLLNAVPGAEGHVLVGAGHIGALDELGPALNWLTAG
jgi:pimeloyl-ACP methyl ester carboxylesterase